MEEHPHEGQDKGISTGTMHYGKMINVVQHNVRPDRRFSKKTGQVLQFYGHKLKYNSLQMRKSKHGSRNADSHW